VFFQTLGALLQAMVRMQINIKLKQVPSMTGFRKVPEIAFPLLWIEEVSIFIKKKN